MTTSEQGGGAMIMVIILLLLSATLLNATRRQLDDSLSLVADERLYFQQSSDAWSALVWGARQSWASQMGWRCKTVSPQAWRACLLEQEQRTALLRGDSGAGTVAFYQWMERRATGRLSKIAHGWLDYCPLQEEGCRVDD